MFEKVSARASNFDYSTFATRSAVGSLSVGFAATSPKGRGFIRLSPRESSAKR